MFIVFDFDGTLCKIDHRLHLIQGKKKNWDEFYRQCVNDVPNTPIIETLKAFMIDNIMTQQIDAPPKHRIEIWSGRSDVVKFESQNWLSAYGVTPLLLTRMRPHKDYTSDVDLKQKWLDEEVIKPDLVFDDRQRVVDMWRSNGITCCQVDAWKETK